MAERYQHILFVSMFIKPSFLLSCFEWLRLWRTVPVLSWVLAAEAYKKDDFEKASCLYEQGIKKHPTHKAVDYARLDYAYCLYKLSRYEESISQLEALLEKKSRLEEIYNLLIKQYFILGLDHLAPKMLSEAKQNFPNNPLISALSLEIAILHEAELAHIIQSKEELEGIRDELDLNDERLVLIDSALANFELAHGEIEIADQMIARLLATGQAPYSAHLMRAQRYLEKDRLLHSREQLRKASKVSPRDPRAEVLLAKTFLMPGTFFDPRAAIETSLQACKKSQWKNPNCLLILAQSYELAEDEDQAEAFYAYANRLQALRHLNDKSISEAKLEVLKLQDLH